ncbi:LD-carboxypeptidase [Cardinium endosymbiont of Sogatella furcifera]|uniref:LD-carboxypeptidase n=1 Tax=Cardinium endosymbiont of Sogatella furcifera TaxID=650378 RepID=UPI000E0D2FBA|nr:LD-carboxypeptidase [Cardinium endosymbiont of Sogatella furcifera]AXI24311.1 LD-carboxypeptidase [Cardinium endosymbiont of Sogatella furcifera]
MRTRFILAILFLLSAFSTLEFEKKHAKSIALLKHIPITIVAPASGLNKGELTALKSIASLRLHIPSSCFDQRQSIFHSNSDELRFKYLKDALFGDAHHVIWTLRGGYGAAKLIPALQKLPMPAREKFFIGYSDITALHIFLTQEWGWKTIHGSGIVEMLKSDKHPANFKKIAEIISGRVKEVTVDQLSPINRAAQCMHTLKGKLTGGNITVLQTGIGTSWQVKTKDKILFLEDTQIKAYQLDRSLLHFTQAGLLKDVKAIIFGHCGADNKEIIKTLNQVAVTLSIPVFKTHRFGHGTINDPIIYNTISQIVPIHDGSFTLIMKV